MGPYQTTAQATALTTAPTLLSANPLPVNPLCSVPNCADFEIAPDTVVFNASGSGYSLTQAGAVIYVNGNLELDNVSIDLKPGDVFPSTGAFIVTGNITIGNNTGGSGQALNDLRIPPTASLEYPTTPTVYPCSALASTGTCDSKTALGGNGKVPFRGFLYAKGNLISNNTGNSWALVGALRVDNLMSIPNTTTNQPSVSVLYDDEIGHSILVDHVELQVDSQQETVVR